MNWMIRDDWDNYGFLRMNMMTRDDWIDYG